MFRVNDVQTLVQNQPGLFEAAGLQNIRVAKIAPETQILYGAIAVWVNLSHTLLTTKLVHCCYSLPNGELRIIPGGRKNQRQISTRNIP